VAIIFLSEIGAVRPIGVYIKISTSSPSKKNYFGTPPARSETGFEILAEFQSRTGL
jgi:hypothetical protein